MNILVISENFTKGGLETHIHSYYTALRQKHHFVFAFGRFESDLPFEANDINTGFNFSNTSSIKDFLYDVEQLVTLIQKQGIDVIHVHPFYSIFPAMVAGQITGVPVVCTHHGPASFTFPSRVNEIILFYYFYSELVSKVFSVSRAGKNVLEKQMQISDVIYLPNALDTELYRRHTVANNRRWAAISRLDEDLGKVSALKKLFEAMPSLPIDAVDIYGDGSQRQMLEDYVKTLGLEKKVRFMGFQSDLYERLDGNYNGIIGADRVAMEGLTMGYPVLELGYGRICGIFDQELIKLGSDCNFVAIDLPECQTEILCRQLNYVYVHPDCFDFRSYMIDMFDIHKVAAIYMENLQNLPAFSLGNMRLFFEQMKELPDKKECIYESTDVFWLMCQQIKHYAVDPKVQILFQVGIERINAQPSVAQIQTLGSRIKHKVKKEVKKIASYVMS